MRQSTRQWRKRYYAKPENKRKLRAAQIRSKKRYRDICRAMCLTILGNKCAICGESRFPYLSLDHINGHTLPANKRRRSSTDNYVEALQAGCDLTKFRVLCRNCNMAVYEHGEQIAKEIANGTL